MRNLSPAVHAAPLAERAWYLTGIWPIVLGLPLIAVVASLSSVWLAVRQPDIPIEAPTRPDIAAMHADARPDAAARLSGIEGRLALANGRLRVSLTGNGAVMPQTLTVVFAHAAKETLDELVTVTRTGPGLYEARAPHLGPGTWYIEVRPADHAWRLTAKATDAASPALLKPHATP